MHLHCTFIFDAIEDIYPFIGVFMLFSVEFSEQFVLEKVGLFAITLLGNVLASLLDQSTAFGRKPPGGPAPIIIKCESSVQVQKFFYGLLKTVKSFLYNQIKLVYKCSPYKF